MKYLYFRPALCNDSPAPHGAGGLKSVFLFPGIVLLMSRPARGGWIEIFDVEGSNKKRVGPAPHGAGGLKLNGILSECKELSPAPHGAGGLKSYRLFVPV